MALLEKVQSQLLITETWLSDEKQQTLQAETELEKYNDIIAVLEQELDVYQDNAETCKVTQQALETKLKKKATVCENLQNLLKQESQLRRRFEQGKISDQIRNKVYQKLREEINELKEHLDYYQVNAETCKTTIQALKIQLEEKLNISESLQNQLGLESELRLQLEEEKQNKDSLTEAFYEQIRDLEIINGVLVDEMKSIFSETNEAEEKLSEEDGEKASLCGECEPSSEDETQLGPSLRLAGPVQQESSGCRHPTFDFLFQTVGSEHLRLSRLDTSLSDQAEISSTVESECKKSRTLIDELKQKLDYYRGEAESCNKMMQEVNLQLKEKDNLLETLQKRLRRESELLRSKFDQQQKIQRNKDNVYEKLKVEISELEEGLDYYQSNAETFKITIQTLKTQLEEQEHLIEDQQQRLKQESELKLRLGQEIQNKDSFNEDLETQIRDLEKSNHDLSEQLETFNSRKNTPEPDEKLSEELEAFTYQLVEEASLCEPQEQTSESLEPDEDYEMGQEVCSPSEEQIDSVEANRSLHENEPSPKDSVPQTVRNQKVSLWRRFKKFLTPACLRKHKVSPYISI
ncbi:myosin heavy chain, clone 203-like [Nothobranchius furzeri]|uniref:myosin heavy chain, clone 203-like n=1 Tax=Nothobranchius furzeri TaxID=105023 RepID=UPI0039048CB5